MSNPPLHNPQDIINKASQEEALFDTNDKLAKSELEDKFDDHNRTKSYKKHLHVIVVIGMYLIGLIILALIFIRAWHLATPDCLHWLDGDSLHTIDAVLFSSVIFSLASKYFSYYKLFQSKD